MFKGRFGIRKKLLSLAFVLVILVVSLAGCGGSSGSTGSTEQGTAATESTAKAVELSTTGDGTYAYEQDLNVIDDNYRNYYEIFVYSYYDSDGDGIGDFNGVTEKLDYIQEMGFNGIWLMPIMPSPSYHKYNVTDYMNVDSQYGTLDDFQNLVDECHARDIRVVIDFEMNHSSSQHPWFKAACDYLKTLDAGQEPDLDECPYVGYYNFSQTQVDGTYYKVSGTDSWYYEGQFESGMPDLNLENEAVRAEFEAIADFWIGIGVDGFRMDAAMHFEEGQTDANNEILNWFYSYCCEQNPDFYMVSEVWSSEMTIAAYYGSETPSMFNFDTASGEGKIAKAVNSGNIENLVDAMIQYQEDFSAENPDYIDAPFLANHDQVRIANAFASDESKLKEAAGLLLTMNGSPFTYYGEEIGMKSTGTEDENKRLPMYWSDTDTTGTTTGPSGSVQTVLSSLPSLEDQLADDTSLVNYYKRALRIRNENPEIARGTIEKVDSLCDGQQAAITKTYDGSTIGIVYNGGDSDLTVSLEGTELSGMQIRGYLTINLDEEKVTQDGDTLVLPAGAICILK